MWLMNLLSVPLWVRFISTSCEFWAYLIRLGIVCMDLDSNSYSDVTDFRVYVSQLVICSFGLIYWFWSGVWFCFCLLLCELLFSLLGPLQLMFTFWKFTRHTPWPQIQIKGCMMIRSPKKFTRGRLQTQLHKGMLTNTIPCCIDMKWVIT